LTKLTCVAAPTLVAHRMVRRKLQW